LQALAATALAVVVYHLAEGFLVRFPGNEFFDQVYVDTHAVGDAAGPDLVYVKLRDDANLLLQRVGAGA
jgi:hypothetical protein